MIEAGIATLIYFANIYAGNSITEAWLSVIVYLLLNISGKLSDIKNKK